VSVVDNFFGPGNDLDLESMSQAANDNLRPWLDRWEAGTGPAFLPRQHDGTLSWYGLMEDGPQRRELEQLLVHWVGPACSDVHIRRGALDADDDFDKWLGRELPGRVVRVDVLPQRNESIDAFKTSRDAVRSRLERLVATLDQRPKQRRAHGAGLGAALDDVYLRALGGDAHGALDLIRSLERRRLLDAPNTAFVRLRTLFLAGRHADVVESTELVELDGQRLPHGIASLVARAIARVLDESDDPATALAAIPGHVVRAAQQADPADPEVASALARLGRTVEVPEGVEDLGTSGEEPPTAAAGDVLEEAAKTAPHLDGARAYALWSEPDYDRLLDEVAAGAGFGIEVAELAVLAADARGDYDAAAVVLNAIDRDFDDPGSIRWRLPGATDALTRLRARRDGTVTSWATWFDAVEGEEKLPKAVLDEAVDWDPVPADEIQTRVKSVGAESLVPILGRFLASHRESMSASQRAQIAPLLLEALALSDRAGQDIRGWSYTLLSDILDGSLDSEARADVLEAIQLLLSQQVTGGTIGWALDVVSETVDAWLGVAPDQLRPLVTETIEVLRQCRLAMTASDVRALELVVEPLGMEVPGDLVAHLAEVEDGDPLACHAGKSILIYSLRERSARQAAARLAKVPGAKITLAHDKAGTTQLGGLVTGSDVVVVVTAAAKHAATGFIEERVTGELVRVNSAGASGLIQALEDCCSRS
jgi:hypothetical protein